MLRLFAAMIDIWGAKWTSHLSDPDKVDRVLKSWTQSFCDLTDEQIFKAFNILKNTEEFPPSIAKFRRRALGICSAEEAYSLAINNKSEYRKLLSSWDWSHLSESECRRKFKASYVTHEDNMLTRCQNFSVNIDGQLEDKRVIALS